MTTAITVETQTARRLSVALAGAGALYAISPVHPPIPCPLRSLTGIPCPLCGMTRAVTAAFRADFIDSLRFNPGGLLLIGLAIAVLMTRSPRQQLRVATWILPVVLAALWVWNIGFNPTFR